AWAGRLPIALCGLVCVAFMLWWLWKEKTDLLTWLLAGIATIGNVSFFLYFRQCRYYGIVILCSVVLSWLYLHWNGSRRALLGMAFLLLCLLASHYMTYAAVVACLVVDYIIWGRRRRALSPIDWVWLLAPQIVLGALIVWIWNP